MWSEFVEPIARALHQRWRQGQIDAGKPAPLWDELDESRRESSRAHARDIPAKLRMVGCAVAPMPEDDTGCFAFTDEEVETLAIAEHDRWMHERLASGWTAGEEDAQAKTTPYLVPFDELPAAIADYDRILVREIPRLLAPAGLQVIRNQPPPADDGSPEST